MIKKGTLFILLVSLSLFAKESKDELEALKKEVAHNKKVMLDGQKCLHNAKSVKEANICNDKIRKNSTGIEIDDFTSWTQKDKDGVDNIVAEYMPYLNCILEAKTMIEASKCKEP